MDPDGIQVIEGTEDGPAEAAAASSPESHDTALEAPEPEAAVLDNMTRHPNHHHDDGSGKGAEGATDSTTVAVERTLTESEPNIPSVATDGTASPAACAITAREKQLVPQQQAPHDDPHRDARLSPASATAATSGTTPPRAGQWPTGTPRATVATVVGGGKPITNHRVLSSEEITAAFAGGAGAADEAAHPQIGNEALRPAARQPGPSSSPTTSSSGSKERGIGETDEEDRSSTNEKNQADLDNSNEDDEGIAGCGDGGGSGGTGGAGSGGGGEYHTNDLPAKLNRLWGAPPPDRAEELAVMRDMLGYRGELDGILSRLMGTKVGH